MFSEVLTAGQPGRPTGLSLPSDPPTQEFAGAGATVPAFSPEQSFDPDEASPAVVLEARGTWALLWFPQNGRSDWVDLSRVDYERIELALDSSSSEN